jgi:oligopeptide transport system substrate-binding protein
MLNTDTKTHYAHLRDKGDYDVARAGWIGDYSDPQNFLFMVESDNDGFNYAGYNNPDYDALMDQAAATVDLDERAKILYQAEQIFMRDLPFIPMLYYSSLSLVSDKLRGWQDNIQNVHASRWMSIAE